MHSVKALLLYGEAIRITARYMMLGPREEFDEKDAIHDQPQLWYAVMSMKEELLIAKSMKTIFTKEVIKLTATNTSIIKGVSGVRYQTDNAKKALDKMHRALYSGCGLEDEVHEFPGKVLNTMELAADKWVEEDEFLSFTTLLQGGEESTIQSFHGRGALGTTDNEAVRKLDLENYSTLCYLDSNFVCHFFIGQKAEKRASGFFMMGWTQCHKTSPLGRLYMPVTNVKRSKKRQAKSSTQNINGDDEDESGGDSNREASMSASATVDGSSDDQRKTNHSSFRSTFKSGWGKTNRSNTRKKNGIKYKSMVKQVEDALTRNRKRPSRTVPEVGLFMEILNSCPDLVKEVEQEDRAASIARVRKKLFNPNKTPKFQNSQPSETQRKPNKPKLSQKPATQPARKVAPTIPKPVRKVVIKPARKSPIIGKPKTKIAKPVQIPAMPSSPTETDLVSLKLTKKPREVIDMTSASPPANMGKEKSESCAIISVTIPEARRNVDPSYVPFIFFINFRSTHIQYIILHAYTTLTDDSLARINRNGPRVKGVDLGRKRSGQKIIEESNQNASIPLTRPKKQKLVKRVSNHGSPSHVLIQHPNPSITTLAQPTPNVTTHGSPERTFHVPTGARRRLSKRLVQDTSEDTSVEDEQHEPVSMFAEE